MSNPVTPQALRFPPLTHRQTPLSPERRAFARMAKRGLVGGREVPIAPTSIPHTLTPIVRWSATIEANGAAVLRVDHEGISNVANIQDYASVLLSSAGALLSMVGNEGEPRANGGVNGHVITRVPAVWKTTEPSVSVRLTDDRVLANHWRASGFHIVELFD
jgi:hypothetical protein